MPLVTCPDCRHQVSERADYCPSCGGPMAPPSGSPSYRPVQTIEKTGKRWKKLRIYGVLAILASPIFMMAGTDTSLALGAWSFIGGLVLLGYARFGAWWHHG